VNSKAHIEITKLMKNDPIIMLMIKTKKDKAAMGAEQ
jgi:hypothetical protein